MKNGNFPIATDRLVLRPYAPDDLSDLHNYHALEEVARYQYWEQRDRTAMEAHVQKCLGQQEISQDQDVLALVVEVQGAGRVIGDLFFAIRDREARQGEIGFSFHPDFQGRGYASEAAGRLMRLGFETYGMHRIFGRCDARNAGSARLMERLGMRKEAHFREHAIFKGGWDEEFVFAILESEVSQTGTR